MRLKLKNRSRSYNKNGPISRHGHKHIEYKMCLNIMMAIRARQHRSNIWSSIYEKVKQLRLYWKSPAHKKARFNSKWDLYFLKNNFCIWMPVPMPMPWYQCRDFQMTQWKHRQNRNIYNLLQQKNTYLSLFGVICYVLTVAIQSRFNSIKCVHY